MAKIPGSVTAHAIITDECRMTHGQEDAFRESIRRLRIKYDEACNGWSTGKGVKIHVALLIERPATETEGETDEG